MARRHSAEERSGSFYRAGGQPAKPPKGLSAPAKRIWREIIASKPLDWFDADQLHALSAHCEGRARLSEIMARLAKEDVGSREFRELANAMKLIGSAVATSARQLRLTVQQAVEPRETKRSERGSTADDLVGGAAVGKLRRAA
jgi:hypothetical protein